VRAPSLRNLAPTNNSAGHSNVSTEQARIPSTSLAHLCHTCCSPVVSWHAVGAVAAAVGGKTCQRCLLLASATFSSLQEHMIRHHHALRQIVADCLCMYAAHSSHAMVNCSLHANMPAAAAAGCLQTDATHHTSVVPTVTGVLDTVWNTWSTG
jgi:hypothetical protein